MDRRPIGDTGVRVTEIGFGASALGDMAGAYGYSVGEERARETIRAIFDGPSNLLDTSRNYGDGRSEARIGAVIRERGGLPDGFVLATKLDRDAETGRFDGDWARRSLEESLTALGVDHVEVLHLHDPEYARDLDEVTREGGAVDVLFRMKEEGLTRAVGLAMGRIDVMTPILRAYPFDALINHNRFTLLNRSADALFTEAHARGVAIFNAAPFAGGVLAKGTAEMKRVTYQAASDEALRPVRGYEALCRAHSVPAGAAALQFSMRDPRITSTLVGVSRPGRIAETLEWAATAIPDALWEGIAEAPYATDDPEAGRVL